MENGINSIQEKKVEEVYLTLKGTYVSWTNRYLRFSAQDWYCRQGGSWLYANYLDTLELEEAYQCLKQS